MYKAYSLYGVVANIVTVTDTVCIQSTFIYFKTHVLMSFLKENSNNISVLSSRPMSEQKPQFKTQSRFKIRLLYDLKKISNKYDLSDKLFDFRLVIL